MSSSGGGVTTDWVQFWLDQVERYANTEWGGYVTDGHDLLDWATERALVSQGVPR